MKLIRLDKYLADLAVGTRSEIKGEIKKGLVTVDDVVVRRPELKIDSTQAVVTYRGEQLGYEPLEYILLNKPAGCVSATEDNLHRTVLDYITDSKFKNDLFPVGRLDIDTEGLLLITNDGPLSHELLSPKKHVAKTYYARIDHEVTAEDVAAFEQGLEIGEKRPTKPAKLKILSNVNENESEGYQSEIEVTITEGKFHQVKRMFEAVGKHVVYLRRIQMGPLKLDETLKPGSYRRLTQEEIDALKSTSDK